MLVMYTWLIDYVVAKKDYMILIIVLFTLFSSLLWARLLVFTETEFIVFAGYVFFNRRLVKRHDDICLDLIE